MLRIHGRIIRIHRQQEHIDYCNENTQITVLNRNSTIY